MDKTKQPTTANDYAIAKALNDLVSGIILQMYVGNVYDLAE